MAVSVKMNVISGDSTPSPGTGRESQFPPSLEIGNKDAFNMFTNILTSGCSLQIGRNISHSRVRLIKRLKGMNRKHTY